ncbi:LysR family transcriptional regulator [Gluconobacter albidus]|uniref:LysR family transcriptional regulator n=1 Tax=Gluconobacter albidus TaxID=318683 RepID=A0AAW3QY40_9PROT|nr:LysR family transcriptional regulator [Gluconobacter albidus]AQS90503.1 LysR family transcriptional regulator [Gluconobacter albidus]KXV38485.1 LysR family transcriptional regulator [Gluconobacter albidus]GBQ88171.1 LysR family transcriptional regulator [Gluconobacter albidus NBRC 3250]GLQ69415.1 LysR family transcriptional regulator [Gluconobacter albidus]
MDTRFLESFIAIVERGSIADAARQLSLTPAAVSQRIKALEDQIRQPLLIRAGRTVTPTAAGLAIIEKSRQLIRGVEELRSLAFQEEFAGELKIGAISTALTGMLPFMLKDFFAEYPQIDLHVTPGQSIKLYHEVLEGQLDCAIIVEPPFAIPKTCGWKRLLSEPLIVLVPESCTQTDPLQILKDNVFLRYDRNQWGGRVADTFLKDNRIFPKEQLELDSLEAIALMVSQGIGISLLPDWLPPWPEGLAVRKIPVSTTPPQRHIGLHWLHSSPHTHLIKTLEPFLATQRA